MNTKNEEFFFIIRICMAFFTIGILGSFVYYEIIGVSTFPIILIKQWLVIDFFLFLGLLLGATDLVIKIKSTKTRALIVSVLLYIVAMIILSKLVWNPFESFIKFIGTTIIFALLAFTITCFYIELQKIQSKKYMDMIEKFKLKNNTIK